MSARVLVADLLVLTLIVFGIAGLILRPGHAPAAGADEGPALEVRLRWVAETGACQVYASDFCVGLADKSGLALLEKRARAAAARGVARARISLGPRVPPGSVAATEATLERAGIPSVSRAADTTAPMRTRTPPEWSQLPIRVTLMWNAHTRQAKVYVGQSYMGLADEGGLKAAEKRVGEI
ncbi:MAG: hypothetical protein L0216_02680, partial [Planctomycetales bacterium]|nr:hypothetical protein [Planctomycetales bacterium]